MSVFVKKIQFKTITVTKILIRGILVSIIFSLSSYSQNVGINTTGATPHASSMLDIVSTSSGLLIPRMTATNRGNIGSPATGLLVYQTDGITGFYYYNGSVWLPLFSASTGWSLSGNATTIAGTNFIGTTDAIDLVFKTSGTERFRVLSSGNVGIGSASPSAKLNILSVDLATFKIEHSYTAGSDHHGGIPPFVISTTNNSVASKLRIWGDPGSAGIRISTGNEVSSGEARLTLFAGNFTFTNGPIYTATVGSLNGGIPGGNLELRGTGSNDGIVFQSGGVIERMRINSIGNIGIGTTSPYSKFHLNSGAANTTAIATIENSSGNFQTFISAATPNSAITGSIGDIANDVTGGVLYYKTSGSATNTGWSAMNGVTGTNWNLTGNTGTAAGTNFLGTTNAVDLVFKTNASERMRISSGGNLGMGVTSPTSKIDIDLGSSNIRAISVKGATGQTQNLQTFLLSDGTVRSFIDNRGAYNYRQNTSGFSYGSNSHDTRVKIGDFRDLWPGGGGVWITQVLNLYKVSNGRPVIGVSAFSADSIAMTFGGGYEGAWGTTFEVRSDVSGAGASGTGNTGGLSLLGVSLIAKRMSQDGTTTNVIPTLGVGRIYPLSGQNLELANSATGIVALRLGSGGRIGIGTTSPSSRLHISTGAANTTAIQTTENTAGDYQNFVTTVSPNSTITGSIGDIANDVSNGIL